MNTNALLIGFAAALAAISGARAADAVVAAEPEPMEYVRVCDTYGTGFFYIPGTEACLKIGGEFRYEKRFERVGHQAATYDNHSRLRLHVESRSESEWGTVYNWIRIQGDQVNNGQDLAGSGDNSELRFYYFFGIGGLEFGNYDSLWKRFMGDGGRTDDGGIHTTDLDYPDSRQYISYTIGFGAVKAFASLDNDADEFYAPEDHDGDGIAGDRGRKYLPDISTGFMGTWGEYQAGAAIGYDESDESFAIKKVFKADIGNYGFSLYGLYSNSSENIYFAYDGFSVLTSFSAGITDSVSLAKDMQWFDNGDWRLVGDINWNVASGFSVLVEGVYFNPDEGADTKSGFLRFQRAF